MEWWHWLLIGLVLVALEMAASGGFYVIFFGIAALSIGALHLFGIAGPLWWQFLLFSTIAILSLLVFRSRILRLLGVGTGAVDVDSLVGQIATPLENIVPGAVGRAELRGTVWSVRNASRVEIVRGQRCTVVRADQLMLFLEPEGAQ